MFSAYTIKKVLPRLLIAAILIQLSWWLCIQAIALNNVVAHGIEGLMYAPFGGAKGLSIANDLIPGGAATGAAAAVSGVAVGGFVAASFATGGGTVVGLLALAGTALLGALIALFLLVVRRVVIVFLVLTVPIAIAAWILPGTQKLWKLWWESFIKLLLVYPMILGLIAAGKIAAYVTAQSNTNDFLSFFIIVICYFGPFFLIPALLKLSGAAFATITGAVNNRGKGAFDRLRNVRANEAKKNKARFAAGERFNNDRLNALSTRVGTKRLGFGRVGRAAYQQKMEIASMEHAKSAAGQSGQHNDGMLQAQTYASEREARAGLAAGDFGEKSQEEINSSIAAARANGGWGRNRQVYAAKQLAVTGTGYENIDQVAQTIRRVSNGNEGQIASLAGFINSTTKGQGRYDLAPGYGALNNLGRTAAGLAPTPARPPARRTVLEDPQSLRAVISATRGADPTTILRGKPAEVKNMADALHQHITQQRAVYEGAAEGSDERRAAETELVRSSRQVRELERSARMGYASEENASQVEALVNELDGAGALAVERLPVTGDAGVDDVRRGEPPAPPPPAPE